MLYVIPTLDLAPTSVLKMDTVWEENVTVLTDILDLTVLEEDLVDLVVEEE